MTATPEVLIVGAGPTGMTLASALLRYGVPFSIIDEKSGVGEESKALTLNAASIWGLSRLGVEMNEDNEAAVLSRLVVYWKGKRFSALDLRHLAAHAPRSLGQPQSLTERTLVDALLRHGVRVNWRTSLVHAEQGPKGVTAFLNVQGSALQETRFDYIVGCDGKRSVVRRLMNAHVKGEDYGAHLVLADFKRSSLMPDCAEYHVFDDIFIIVVPAGRDRCRIVVKRDGAAPLRSVEEADILEAVHEKLGNGLVSGPPLWLSRAQLYLRVSDTLRKGRFLLAGDAAHLFSPIGGTGMNTGMQDALNLAWRLAYVAQGKAGDEFLELYQQERLAEINKIARATDVMTRAILQSNDTGAKQFIPRMQNRSFLRFSGPELLSGLAPMYRNFVDADPRIPGLTPCGTICLGLNRFGPVEFGNLPPFLLFAYPETGKLEETARRLSVWIETSAARQMTLQAVVVGEKPASLSSKKSYISWRAPSPNLCGELGIIPGYFLLVRPDGIVQSAGPIDEILRARSPMPVGVIDSQKRQAAASNG